MNEVFKTELEGLDDSSKEVLEQIVKEFRIELNQAGLDAIYQK